MLLAKVRNREFCILNDTLSSNQQTVYYAYGFNKEIRSEINIYSINKSLITNDSDETVPSLKIHNKIQYGKNENITFLGFLNCQQESEKQSNNNKRKLDDDSETVRTQTFLVVILSNKSILVYDVSGDSKDELEPVEIKMKNEIKSATLSGDRFWILDSQNNIECYSVLGAIKKSLQKYKVSTKKHADSHLVSTTDDGMLIISYDSTSSEISVDTFNSSTGKVEKSNKISIEINLEDADEDSDVEEDESEGNVISAIQVSKIHDDLVYLKFSKDDGHIYIYSISTNKITHRLNSVEPIVDFKVFRIKNMEYVISSNFNPDDEAAANSFALFKCVFRRNATNINTTVQINYRGVPKNLEISSLEAFTNSEVISVIEKNTKATSFNVEEILATKEKIVNLDINVKYDETDIVKSINTLDITTPAKKKKLKPKRKKRVVITGNETIDELFREFKSIQNDVEKLVDFSIKNNYNVPLIKTILKNSGNEDVDNILNCYMKHFFKNPEADMTYLKLYNWFRMILIYNGGYIIKNAAEQKKKIQMLKKFQTVVRENNNHLNDFLNLQGKLSLLKSQYELRNQIYSSSTKENNRYSDDFDDDDAVLGNGNATKTHNQLLNNVIKEGQAVDSNEGVQLIEDDAIIYENGEVDEKVDDDDVEQDEENNMEELSDEEDDE